MDRLVLFRLVIGIIAMMALWAALLAGGQLAALCYRVVPFDSPKQLHL